MTTVKPLVNYSLIANRLKPNYRVENCIKIDSLGEKEIGVRVHVNSIVKGKELFYIECLFAGWGLSIYYANNEEYIYIKIPE